MLTITDTYWASSMCEAEKQGPKFVFCNRHLPEQVHKRFSKSVSVVTQNNVRNREGAA